MEEEINAWIRQKTRLATAELPSINGYWAGFAPEPLDGSLVVLASFAGLAPESLLLESGVGPTPS